MTDFDGEKRYLANLEHLKDVDFLKEYNKNCLTCKHYDLEQKEVKFKRHGFYCECYHRPMAFCESCHSHYEKDYFRDNKQILKAISKEIKYYDGIPDSSYWYLVTALNEILGYERDSKYILSAKKIREYAKKNAYNSYLYYYDKYGYKLAIILLTQFYLDRNNFINLDNNIKERYGKGLKEKYLDPLCYWVESGCYDTAILVIRALVLFLMEYYQIDFEYDFKDEPYEVEGLKLDYSLEPVYSLECDSMLVRKKNKKSNIKLQNLHKFDK